MKYKRVGKIDFDFSALGFGCWGASGIGSWTNHEDAKQIEAIQVAIDSGINFFDVAPIYGYGHAEEVLGKAMKGRREEIFIATKVGIPWNEKFEASNDVTAVSILREIDDSLTRLGVDQVDLYQVHWPSDKGVPLEETIKAIESIKKDGKTKYLGLSNFSVKDWQTANEITEIVSMQGLFNMLEQDSESYHGIPLQYRTSTDIFPLVRSEGLAFFPYSPLFQGLLTGKITLNTVFGEHDVRKNNPKLQGDERSKHLRAFGLIQNLEELQGRPLAEISVNYLVAKNEITSVIATHADKNEVRANIDALEWHMDPSTVQKIDDIVADEIS
jgi:aryl-alcohol dehydrogenase-like predicted oxidoreductase